MKIPCLRLLLFFLLIPTMAGAVGSHNEEQIKALPKIIKKLDVKPGKEPPARFSLRYPKKKDRGHVTVREEFEIKGGAMTIRYVFQKRPPASAFMYQGRLYLVFSGDFKMERRKFSTSERKFIEHYRHDAPGTELVVQIDLKDDKKVVFSPSGEDWVVHISKSKKSKSGKKNKAEGRINLHWEVDPSQGRRLMADLHTDRRPVTIRKRDGSQHDLLVFTTRKAGLRNDQARRHLGGVILPSLQGLVVEVLYQNLQAIRFPQGVALIGLETTEQSAPLLRTTKKLKGSRKLKADLGAWQGDPDLDFKTKESRLVKKIGKAHVSELTDLRMGLVMLYMGHGLFHEASGILEIVSKNNPELEDRGQFRLMRGICNLKMGRARKAYGDLNSENLDGFAETWLWRMVALQKMRNNSEALIAWEIGRKALHLYASKTQVEFMLTAIRADFASGSGGIAKKLLEQLRETNTSISRRPLSDPLHSEIMYWSAVQKLNEPDRAMAVIFFTRAQKSANLKIRSLAKIGLIDDEYRRNVINDDQAIERLDRLRFAWRGDDVELEILRRMGQHYLRKKDFRNVLYSWKQAVTYTPPSEKTKKIAVDMEKLFRDLFLSNLAKDLPTTKAMALYYEFRDLTPLGDEGDRMIRGLVDRLARVGLYKRAADLLSYQVHYRLEGIPQANIAGKLAKIYLKGGEPKKAVEILQATRQTMLPKDIEKRRTMLSARAHLELGEFDTAEVILDGKNDLESRIILADIFWARRNWKKLVEINETMLPRTAKELDSRAQKMILRSAVGLAMINDAAKLKKLRARYLKRLLHQGKSGPKQKSMAVSFDLITSPDSADRLQDLPQLERTLASVRDVDETISKYRQIIR